ncbi:ABC transporter ATP-binding protein/permease [Puniceicoccaceae bacterium K14]|nr:ABC transporter ATP-binding protein/permease [Puniceicoccaceae bacterium K14]
MLKKLKDGLRLRRGLKLVWAGSRKWVFLSLILTVAIGVLPVGSLYLQKLFFDAFADGMVDGTGIAAKTLIVLVLAMAGIEIVIAGFRSLAAYVTTAQGQTLQDYVMQRLHKKSIELDLSFYETPSYFDSLHIAQTEAPKRTAAFVDVLAAIAREGLSLVSVLALLMTYHWGIALLLLVAVAPGFLVQVKSSNKLFQWQKEASGREREANYYHDLLTQAVAAKESRVFGFGPVISEWYVVLRTRLREELLRIAHWKQTRSFFVTVGATLALFGGFFLFAKATSQGVFTLGDMALFYAGFNRAQGHLRALVAGVSGLYESNLFLGKLFEVLESKSKIVSPKSPIGFDENASPEIALKNVSFKYPGTTRQALSDVSLTITPGEHVAIVGKNGSGKSTFVKLLCRLYDRTEGEVTINGIDVREVDLAKYRSRFSVLFQDYLQFGLSAQKNIWLGDVSRDLEDGEAIAEAARLSGAAGVIDRLPEGYETVLGKVIKEGEQLSQGEWQKLALARALYTNAKVTILDEPTSWMDPESEQEFFDQFHRLSTGRTAIMISHRLSTVKMVDRIVVMERGQILEIGKHDELMAKKGRYFELYELQAKDYR